MTGELTDAEREALLCDVGCEGEHSKLCAAVLPDVYTAEMSMAELIARIEALIEARVAGALTKQAEDIAVAIESHCTLSHGGDVCFYTQSARIAREFGQQKEADRG